MLRRRRPRIGPATKVVVEPNPTWRPCPKCDGIGDRKCALDADIPPGYSRITVGNNRAWLHCTACSGTGYTTDGKRIGRALNALTRGMSWCGRCETPWAFVKGHSTTYAEGRGCFPLCEECWAELGTPAARMPYYRELWGMWEHDGTYPNDIAWEAIETAVNNETDTPEPDDATVVDNIGRTEPILQPRRPGD